MNNILYNILNDVSEGIVILNEKLEISFWNNFMERITNINKGNALSKNIYSVLPNLNVNYFNKEIRNVINNGSKMFLSASMHIGLINDKENFNLKISRFEEGKSKFLLLEFIDVTNQFIQINRLKSSVKELYKLNKQLEEQKEVIKNLAYYDKLTGVTNRTLFYEIAEKFLDTAKRNNTLLGLIFIDIDKFKNINDTYGHEVGDKVLIKVAEVLKQAIRKNDIVARYGGDEFLILLPFIKNIKDYEIIVSRIVNNNNKNINYKGQEINISLSMGISFYPNDGDSVDKLMAKADKAMYVAKNQEGQDCFVCNVLQYR